MNARARNSFLAFLLCLSTSCDQASSPFDNPAPATIYLSPTPLPSTPTKTYSTQSQGLIIKPTLRPTEYSFLSTTSSACDWEMPLSLTQFSFGGRLLLATRDSTQNELLEITNTTQQIHLVGKFPKNFGARLRPSPDGKWILSTTTWNPLEDKSPPNPLVIASDLSNSFMLNWKPTWDITLGWWDNSKIIVLPSNGQTDEVALLDVFTQSISPLANVALAVNRDYGETFWSPWREKDGETVFFNHTFSQVLFFDQAGSLALANTSESELLWAFNQPTAFFSDNQTFASWSPNDEFVAFPAWRGSFQNIYLLSKTGLLTQVTDFSISGKPDTFVRLAAWSPDGSKLAFTVRSRNEVQTSSSLFMLDLQQAEIRELCTLIDDVVWSPDSRYLNVLVFNEDSSNKSQLIVIDAQSGEKWLIAEDESRLGIVGWSAFP